MLIKPMELQVGLNRVRISWGSAVWYMLFTLVGTVIGAVAYAYIQNYLPDLPASTTATNVRASAQPGSPG